MVPTRGRQFFVDSPSSSSATPITSALPSPLLPYPPPPPTCQQLPYYSLPPYFANNSEPRPFSSTTRPSLPSSRGRGVEEISGVTQGSSLSGEEGQKPLKLYHELERTLMSKEVFSDRSSSEQSGFSNFGRRGSASPLPPLNHLLPPLPSLAPSSTHSFSPPHPSTPLPASNSALPLLPIGWSPGDWTSENPFSSSSEKRNNVAGVSKPVEYLLIQSAEETRTRQACQACRIRKSKCDGQDSCIRCEKKGLRCVYVLPPPRHGRRGKGSVGGHSRTSSSSSSSHSSLYVNEISTSQFHLTPSPLTPNLDQRVDRLRGERSDGLWGEGVQGWRNKVRSGPSGGAVDIGGFREVKEERGLGSSSYEPEEERRRRRFSANCHPASPLASLPLGSSRSTSPSYNHSQPQHSRDSYPTGSYDQTFQPRPCQAQDQHQHSSTPPPPSPSPVYPSALRSSEPQPGFYLITVPYRPSPLHYPPSFESYPQPDASSFEVGKLSSNRASQYPQDLRQTYIYTNPHLPNAQEPSLRSSFGWEKTSSFSSLTRSSCAGGGGGSELLTPAWEEDQWSRMGYCG